MSGRPSQAAAVESGVAARLRPLAPSKLSGRGARTRREWWDFQLRPAQNTPRASKRERKRDSRNSPGGGGAPDDGGRAHHSRPVGHQAAAADRRRRRRRRWRRGRRQAAKWPPGQHHGPPLRQQRVRAEELTSAVHVVTARAHQRRTRRTHVVERRDRRTRRPVGADAALHSAALRHSTGRQRPPDLYFWQRARGRRRHARCAPLQPRTVPRPSR